MYDGNKVFAAWISIHIAQSSFFRYYVLNVSHWRILAVLAFYEHFSHCVGFTYLNSQLALPQTHTDTHWHEHLNSHVTVSESGKNLICIHFWIWRICYSSLAFILWFARLLFQIFHHQDIFSPHTDVLHSACDCIDLTFAISYIFG